MKAQLLINPRSRKSSSALPAIKQACQKYGIEVTKTHRLKNTVNLKSVLSDASRQTDSLLIVGGGDGTISAVVSAAADAKITLGLVPLGTTNNFARSLDLPMTIDESVKRIAAASPRSVDLGKIDKDYFSNVASIGISAKIAKRITDKHKRRFGRFAYLVVGLQTLITHRSFTVTVADKDGDMELHFTTHQMIIANGRYHAGKEIAEDAAVDNRELIIFALGGRSKLSFIKHMMDFYLGRRKNIKDYSYFIGRDVKIKTSRQQLVEIDGEVKQQTPLRASVAGKVVRIRY